MTVSYTQSPMANTVLARLPQSIVEQATHLYLAMAVLKHPRLVDTQSSANVVVAAPRFTAKVIVLPFWICFF